MTGQHHPQRPRCPPALRLFSGLFALLLHPALALAYSEAAADAEYFDRGTDGCLMCHSAASDHPAVDILDTVHGLRADANSPFAAGNRACESCHGPSAAHVIGQLADGSRPPPAIAFSRDEPAAVQDTACLACHTADAGHHWQGSAHQFEEVSCTGCHQVHPARDPVLVRATQAQVCTDCHRRERAEFLRPSRHPLLDGARIGSMVCTDCHAPHGALADAELRHAGINENCTSCHAEYRGPFLWEHAPVSEDCTSCHTPHGSSHRSLLARRTPWMCQECHLAQFHPSTVESGTGLPSASASRQMLGRDCMNCHTQVHGSNHPSGAGLIR